MLRSLPLGISDFKAIMDNNAYYVDKTLLIGQLLQNDIGVFLFPRPRRFGKTLNLNMLKYFFDNANKESTQYLFHNLNIWQDEALRKEQGQYPVIFLTFKDIKFSNWQDTIESIQRIIRDLFASFRFLKEGNFLDEYELGLLNGILTKTASIADFGFSLKLLSSWLERYYNKKVIILIDEYDMPINAGFNANYYDEVISFMRVFLSAGLKDNSSLKFACLTGILRIAKESIFSGLNNLYVSNIFDDRFSDFFGFTEKEVYQIADSFNQSDKKEEVKRWYNGYVFGKTEIYNPWSVINYFIREVPSPEPYWINTSSNDLIELLLAKATPSVKKQFEILIENGVVEQTIDDNIVYNDVFLNVNALWSFLLMSGYLKAIDKTVTANGTIRCSLAIPNLELLGFYRKLFLTWLTPPSGEDYSQLLIDSLLNGKVDELKFALDALLVSTISYFDNNESFYHGLVLGLLVELRSTYTIKSNRESGFGRYDIMLFPKDNKNVGIVIEFKAVLKGFDDTVENLLAIAHKQISEKAYSKELQDFGVHSIYEYAIVFKGKECFVSLQVFS